MYDWFVLFVCNVTEEPHQSQFSVWCNKRYTPVFFPKAKKTICMKLLLLPTSLVILAIWTERFGRYIASQPSPSWLADAVPDVLIQDAPPIVVAQPGAAVCQHITYMSNSQTHQDEEIRMRRRGRGEKTRAKGAFRVDGGEGGTKMIKKKKKKDSNKWTYGTIHLQQDWGWGAGEVGSCEALRSFHMSFTIMCNHSIKGNAWDKRTTNHLRCLLTVEKPVGDAANACWVKCSQQWFCV